MAADPTLSLDEAAVRRVLLVQAFETGSDDVHLWTTEDRAWATRMAREAPGVGDDPARLLAERSRHAVQRLTARDRSLARWVQPGQGVGRWLLLASGLAAVAGLVIDQIGPSQRVNLLAPWLWALVAWNLLVYGLLIARALGGGKPGRAARALVRLWQPLRSRGAVLVRFAEAWGRVAWPLNLNRAALVLHVAAAAMAAGMVGGLYLRGLVLDYRAAWESTFLEPAQVQVLLSTLLAPASRLTGIGVPGVEALAAQRAEPGAGAAVSAAPWLHLYAATLALWVIGPRLLLALGTALRIGMLKRRWALPLAEPYFAQLLRPVRRGPARVWVLPHAEMLGGPAALGLRSLLAARLGEDLQLQIADPQPYGDVDGAALRSAPPDAGWRLLLFDAGGTPEEDVHGQLMRAFAQAASGGVAAALVDESAFARRFAATPERVAQRRAAWEQVAEAAGLRLACVDLSHPGPDAARALQGLLGA